MGRGQSATAGSVEGFGAVMGRRRGSRQRSLELDLQDEEASIRRCLPVQGQATARLLWAFEPHTWGEARAEPCLREVLAANLRHNGVYGSICEALASSPETPGQAFAGVQAILSEEVAALVASEDADLRPVVRVVDEIFKTFSSSRAHAVEDDFARDEALISALAQMVHREHRHHIPLARTLNNQRPEILTLRFSPWLEALEAEIDAGHCDDSLVILPRALGLSGLQSRLDSEPWAPIRARALEGVVRALGRRHDERLRERKTSGPFSAAGMLSWLDGKASLSTQA
jgi:hypothetical protein